MDVLRVPLISAKMIDQKDLIKLFDELTIEKIQKIIEMFKYPLATELDKNYIIIMLIRNGLENSDIEIKRKTVKALTEIYLSAPEIGKKRIIVRMVGAVRFSDKSVELGLAKIYLMASETNQKLIVSELIKEGLNSKIITALARIYPMASETNQKLIVLALIKEELSNGTITVLAEIYPLAPKTGEGSQEAIVSKLMIKEGLYHSFKGGYIEIITALAKIYPMASETNQKLIVSALTKDGLNSSLEGVRIKVVNMLEAMASTPGPIRTMIIDGLTNTMGLHVNTTIITAAYQALCAI